MTDYEYTIKKFRFGRDGQWNDWEFEAVSNTLTDKLVTSISRGTSSDRYGDLDSLARELATFPDIKDAEFIPSYDKHCPRVSLSESSGANALTQWAIITDEELGELGALVQKYTMKYQK